jgi:hypothetical protein
LPPAPDNIRMSRFTRLCTLVGGLFFFGLSPLAQADTMLDLVREMGAQKAPASADGVTTTTKASRRCRARKARALKARAHKARRHRAVHAGRRGVHRNVARSAPRSARRLAQRLALRLTAQQRGSGRIDVIDAGGPISFDSRPAIEAKPGL